MYDLGGTQSWIPTFDIMLKKYPFVKSIIEFGAGYGTEYLLGKSDRLISMEIIANDNHERWAEKCKEMYNEYKLNGKWIQQLYRLDSHLKKIDEDYSNGIQPASDSYRYDLISMLGSSMGFGPFDLAFVDCGIHMRGDIVNILMKYGIPIIVAHDTNIAPEKYGWDKISNGTHYKNLTFPYDTCGTTFWVRNFIEEKNNG